MKLLNFTILKLTLCLIIGIIFGYFIKIPLLLSLIITSCFLLLCSIFYLIQKQQFKQYIWFGILAYLCMIGIGVLTVNLHNQKHFKDHYSKYIASETQKESTIIFRVREVLKPGNYYDKYIIEVLKTDSVITSGKTLLNIKKDSTFKHLNIDDVYVTKTDFKNLIHPLNPGQFDYKNYLEKQYIYHQLFTEPSLLLRAPSNKTTLLGIANTIRNHINIKLKRYNFKPDELAIINALLLGQRQDISEQVYKSYTNAGAIHILAISGLHIGIILIILNHLFKPIERLKHGTFLKAVIIIFILWCFAIIAGLSASVTRAVTMFSIVTIGMHLKRPTNIYNTLAISMLVLLLFKPLFLFDVGFQLSYVTVFSIVTLDPIFYKLFQPKNKLLDIYWHTFTITIAAQFGIIPISLYYFHQFPALFFISNLVIIPILGFILGLGLFIILLAVLDILPHFLAQAYGYIISFMNRFISWVASQDLFLFQDIAFSLLYVLTFYLVIVTFFKWCFKKNYTNLKWFLISIVLLQVGFIYTAYTKPNYQFVVFHKSRYSLLGHTINDTVYVADDFDSITTAKNSIIKDYRTKKHISNIANNKIKPIYMLKDQLLIVVDSLGVYGLSKIQPDYVLLRQSPKLNLNRLIDTLKPNYIIADGSNYKSYIEDWARICLKKNVHFHQTSKNGAFVIDY